MSARAGLAWFCTLLVALLAWGVALLPGFRLETSLLALLPQQRQDPGLKVLEARSGEDFARRLTLVVHAATPEHAIAAADAVAAGMRNSKAFREVRWQLPAESIPQALHHSGFAWLREEDLGALAHHPAELANAATQALYSPTGMARRLSFSDDPLGLFEAGLQAAVAAPAGIAPLGAGLGRVTDQGADALILATTADSALQASSPAALGAAIADARATATKLKAEVRTSGVAPHALAAATTAQREASRIGTVSTLLCAALVFAVFGALRPAFLALLSMAVGMLLGLVGTHALLGPLHLFTLVFGTSLVGVSLDYALHFLSDQFRAPIPSLWQPLAARQHMRTALWMGLATSALGYCSFATAPLPVLQQMAVFSVLGLLGAAATVWLAFPALATPAPLTRSAAWLRLAAQLGPKPMRWWFWALMAAALAAGITQLRSNDSPRALQSSPPDLLAQEQAVREVLGGGWDARHLMVRGADEQAVLAREQAALSALQGMRAEGKLQGWQGISALIPPTAISEARRAAWLAAYAPQGAVAQLYQTLGLPPSQLAADAARFAAAPLPTLSALQSESLAALRGLWLGSDGHGQVASLVLLRGVRADADLTALAKLPGVSVQDPVGSAEQALKAQRHAALPRLLGVYGLMWALLAWRYGALGGVRTLLPPMLGSLSALAIQAALGRPLNLFVLLSLLPVLGFGVDYAIFLREGARHSESAPLSSRLAVWLAALTSVLTFGGLAFTSTPFLRDIGTVLATGVAASLLFALLLAPRQSAPHEI